MISSEEYQVQDIYEYRRQSYKKGYKEQQEQVDSPRTDIDIEMNQASPRIDGRSNVHAFDSPDCSCDLDPEGDIASILHKKCPVISLAQQQLQRLLDEADKFLCENHDNTRCCRSVYDLLFICKEIFLNQDKCKYALVFVIVVAFLVGLLIGAASCGSYLGKFNSPLLTCIDNYFISDSYSNVQDTYLSVT